MKGADGEWRSIFTRFGRVATHCRGPLRSGYFESLSIDRKTVRSHTAPAIAAGIEPGGEPLSRAAAELTVSNDPAARGVDVLDRAAS